MIGEHMHRILKKIEFETLKLEGSQLCLWLKNDKAEHEDYLSFTPSMLFFVLGFKDVLSAMQVINPKTDVDNELNTHCQEDLDHWKWYLQDLETMGYIPESWGSRMSDMFHQIWGDESFEVRNLVYTLMHQVKKYNDPYLSLVIIEYLEASFAVFIRHMLIPINDLDIYKKLNYFGKTHVEKEEAHSRGSWVEGHRSVVDNHSKHEFDEVTLHSANLIIDELSFQMLQVFNYWYSTRNKFSRFMPQEITKYLDKEKGQLV